MRYEAAVTPAGANINSPQINTWKIGLVQNSTNLVYSAKFEIDHLFWSPRSPNGTSAVVLDPINATATAAGQLVDCTVAPPLYHSFFGLENLGNWGEASDSPQVSYLADSTVSDNAGNLLRYSYKTAEAKLDGEFKSWTVAYDFRSGMVVPLCEGSWNMVLDSSGKKPQRLKGGAILAAANPPVTNGTTANAALAASPPWTATRRTVVK